MRKYLFIVLIPLLFLPGCTSKIEKTDRSLPIPDNSTYFPLTKGSCWYYVSISEGEAQDDFDEFDSVINLEKQPSCYLATVLRYSGSKTRLPDTMYFKVDSNGNVHKKFHSDEFELYAYLFPDTLKKVMNEYNYVKKCGDGCYQYCTFNWDMADRTDTIVWDTAYSEPYYSWRFRQFEKGIGETSAGMSDTYSRLKYYRIGPDTTTRQFEDSEVQE